ncbi:MAG: type III pantothenate kinase [Nitrospiraceae bacterium]|nr:type III pantothenate kinase [Nitrospiraceae bacterium]
MAVDIGNTSISIGLFEKEEPYIINLATHPLRSAEDYIHEIEKGLEKYGFPERPDSAALCSVVSSHTEVFEKALSLICAKGNVPLIISHRVIKDMKFAVSVPAGVGPDRLASSYGAFKLYGGPVVSVDLGTATTLNFVSGDGAFLGGAILPGVGLMAKSLKEATSRLPFVDTGIEAPLIKEAIGRETSASILSGIVYGTAGAVGRILEEAEMERLEQFKVALTGGNSGLVAPFLKRIDYHEPALTLKGIRLIHMAS